VRVERVDGVPHLAFDKLPPAEAEPIPTQPSDPATPATAGCRRTSARRRKDLRRAEGRYERAEQHWQKCQRQLAEFATLEDDIIATTIEALRCGVGRLDPGLSEEMELRLADRKKARSEATAVSVR
jgi:hypothetical protein